jgi:hypothetical protein
MYSLINANQLLQEESHGCWKKVDKFATVTSGCADTKSFIIFKASSSWPFSSFCSKSDLRDSIASTLDSRNACNGVDGSLWFWS